MTLHNSIRNLSRLVLGVSLGAIVISANVGCRNERSTKRPRQFFPGMDDQPKYKAQAQSKFFEDGRTMREPVAGTVPFGRQAAMAYGSSVEALTSSALNVALDRQDLLRDDDRVYKGVNPDGSYLATAPIHELDGLSTGAPLDSAVVSQLVLRGQEQFNIFCMVCHGKLGEGKGMVGAQWSYPLPNFHDPAYQPGGEKGQDGYIFHVIRNGVPNQPGTEPALRMPSYAGQINARDAWAIVLYFRALQESVKGSIDEVPTQEREKLLTNRPTAMVKPVRPTGDTGATVQATDAVQSASRAGQGHS
jgi:mono/diheme cytochrome c family protein